MQDYINNERVQVSDFPIIKFTFTFGSGELMDGTKSIKVNHLHLKLYTFL